MSGSARPTNSIHSLTGFLRRFPLYGSYRLTTWLTNDLVGSNSCKPPSFFRTDIASLSGFLPFVPWWHRSGRVCADTNKSHINNWFSRRTGPTGIVKRPMRPTKWRLDTDLVRMCTHRAKDILKLRPEEAMQQKQPDSKHTHRYLSSPSKVHPRTGIDCTSKRGAYDRFLVALQCHPRPSIHTN